MRSDPGRLEKLHNYTPILEVRKQSIIIIDSSRTRRCAKKKIYSVIRILALLDVQFMTFSVTPVLYMNKLSTKVSAYILAKNEASNIQAAIQSVSWADEVLVVDTGSEDNTVALAKEQGARVIEIPFTGFGDVRNKALAACKHDWVYVLDADERCTDALRDEIHAFLATHPAPAVFLAPTKNYILDHWMRHGGWYPDYRHPAFYAKQALSYKNDAVHEGYIANVPVQKFKQARIHYPYPNLTAVMSKANRYSSLGVERLQQKQKKPSFARALGHASWKFFNQYVIKRGFLDGWPGFIMSLNAFYDTFFRYAKYVEASRS